MYNTLQVVTARARLHFFISGTHPQDSNVMTIILSMTTAFLLLTELIRVVTTLATILIVEQMTSALKWINQISASSNGK